jgi:hypothetical protein
MGAHKGPNNFHISDLIYQTKYTISFQQYVRVFAYFISREMLVYLVVVFSLIN